nr:RusA family crossover junction endodeoxyribonuclease [Kosakonia radicincitans]
MTRSDKWKKRPEVMRYRAFCDEVRICGVVLPVAGAYVTFILPMPASWSKKKRAEMNGKPHQVKPDKDNLEKALLDALFENDAHIWDSRVTKLWGESGQIIIEEDALCVFS